MILVGRIYQSQDDRLAVKPFSPFKDIRLVRHKTPGESAKNAAKVWTRPLQGVLGAGKATMGVRSIENPV